MLYIKDRYRYFKHLIVIPVISTVIIPMVIMDLWMEIYHRICFPLCGISYIKRKDYIKIMDRARLKYLNLPQKAYCMYCGYGNGVFRYWKAISGKTEYYWCGIQHEQTPGFIGLDYQKEFSTYGNEEEFNEKFCKLSS